MTLLLYFGITVLLEYLVLLLFFWREWWPCMQFVVLINTITWPIGMYAYNDWGANWYLVEGCIFLVEAIGIYFFWRISAVKALLISTLANGLTAGLIPFLNLFGINFPS